MTTLLERVKRNGVPRHVAIIMDGNGRWAQARGLPRTAGHHAGAQAAERIIRFAGRQLGLPVLTLYAFSTENWLRPADEVDYLMDLLRTFIDEKLHEFVDEGVRLSVLGETAGLPGPIRVAVERAVRETGGGDRLRLNVALNYGGRQEIARACRRIAAEVAAGRLALERVDPAAVTAHLYDGDLPDADLIIRTSGEMRLSNFLLWQAAYAELHFTETLWPDFTPAELLEALAEFQRRDRRFGGRKGDE